MCNASCENYVPGVTYTAQTNDEGVYTVELTSSFINYHVYLKEATYPYLATGTQIANIYVSSDRTIHFVIPFAESTQNCQDSESPPDVNDCAEALLAANHNPYWNFAPTMPDDCSDETEDYFPVDPKGFYELRSDGLKDDEGHFIVPTPSYDDLTSYSNPDLHKNYKIAYDHSKALMYETEDIYFYHVSPDSEHTHHRIQYYLFFDFNDTDISGSYGDHEGDWEWLCVYVDSPSGAFYDHLPSDNYPGGIYKLHYHKHGDKVGEYSCSTTDEEWRVVEYTKDIWEEGKCKSDGHVYTRDDFIYDPYHQYSYPETPRVWVGDSQHGLYPGPPCRWYNLHGEVLEWVGNSGAPIHLGGAWYKWVHFLSKRISIDKSDFDSYDDTVHDFAGMWGDDCVPPPFRLCNPAYGPRGPENDRDYDVW